MSDLNTRFVGVRTEPGPLPRLLLDIAVKNDSDTPAEILLAKAEVSVRNPMPPPEPSVVQSMLAGPPTRPRPLGAWAFVGYGTVTEGGTELRPVAPKGETRWSVVLPVPRDARSGIEHLRRRGDVSLKVSLTYLRVNRENALWPRYEWEHLPDPDHPHDPYLTIKIAESDWRKLLRQLTYGDPPWLRRLFRSLASKAADTGLGALIERIFRGLSGPG